MTSTAASAPVAPWSDQAASLRRLARCSGQVSAPAAPDQVEAWPPPTTIEPVAHAPPLVTIASGKGGVGKTTLAVSLCIALRRLGRRPVLVDADLGTANADILCGLEPRHRPEQVLASASARSATPAGLLADIARLAVPAPGGFTLLPGVAALHTNQLAAVTGILLAAAGRLAPRPDLVVVDAPAGVGRAVVELLRAAALPIVVATGEPTAIADAYALIKCAFHSGQRLPTSITPRLVVNQARDATEAALVHARLDRCCQRFLALRVVPLGAVQADPAVPASVRRRVPLVLARPRARASRDIRRLAARVAQSLPLPDPPSVHLTRPQDRGGLLGRSVRLWRAARGGGS